MDVGLIVTLVFTVIFGFTTIFLTVYLFRKQFSKQEPVWAFYTTKIIGLGSDAPKELALTFNGKPVSEVYRTLFLLFNRGKKAIRKEDIAKPITVHFENSKILHL